MVPSDATERDLIRESLEAVTQQLARLEQQVSEGREGVKREDLEQLREQVAAAASAGARLSAPVLLPSSEAMAVRLVSAGALDRLDEYHADDALYLAIAGIFAGGALGMLVNLATEPDAKMPGSLFWILLVVLAIAAGLFFAQSRKTRTRAARLRAEVMAPATVEAPALPTDPADEKV